MTDGPPPEEPVAAAGARRRLGLIVGVALLVLALDQLTKWWALEQLADGSIDVIWTFRFHLAFNSGMAFSQGRGLGPVIGALALVVIVVLVVTAAKGTSTLGAIAVGMIAGGAAGNIADRLFRSDDGFLQGRVVDFIDFQWWPVFNVADMGVVIGGLLLVLSAWSGSEPAK